MLTKYELVQELRRRDVHVTLRRLTSWLSKDLLPNLKRSSNGCTRTPYYAWVENDIVERAALIYDLISAGVQGEEVLLCLWFAGYQVDLSKVRKAWFNRFNRAILGADGCRRNDELIEDFIGDQSAKIAKKIAKQRGLESRLVSELLLETERAFYFNKYEFNIEQNADLVSMANVFLRGLIPDQSVDLWLNSDKVKAFFDFVRSFISIKSREKLLSSTADVDLRIAHERWKILFGLLRNALKTHSTIETKGEIDELLCRLSIVLGPIAITWLLWISRMGGEERLFETSILLACSETSEHPNKIVNSLIEIWKGFTIYRFQETRLFLP